MLDNMEKKAENLDEVYRNFDPLLPLKGNSIFYVERKNNPLGRLKLDLLRENRRRPKYLFSGHRGSGKSTELNRLSFDSEMQKKYFIVHYSVREILDIAGLDYTDVLFSIGAQIFMTATENGLKLREKLLDELSNWMDKSHILEEEKSEALKGETGLQAGLNNFFVKVLGTLKVGYEARENIRSSISLRISELIEKINIIIAEVELESKRNVLVIIEDMDKPDLSNAKEIFCERQSSLTLPNCSIIYTVPIALIYSHDAGQFKHAFDDIHTLPNITLYKRGSSEPNENGQTIMKNFVKNRMSEELIDFDALEHAIKISGGVFREMTRIIRSAGDNAAINGRKKILIEDTKKAESEIRNEFRRMLRIEDYDELKKIHKNCKLEMSNERANLLHNLAILEYQNDENWCDVHPAILPLIKD